MIILFLLIFKFSIQVDIKNLKVIDTAEWSGNGNDIFPLRKHESDKIPSFPKFQFQKYSYVLTQHNSYYYVNAEELYYFVDYSSNIATRGSKCVFEDNTNKTRICKETTLHLKDALLQFREDWLIENKLKIKWNFIETHEMNAAIGFKLKHPYDMPET